MFFIKRSPISNGLANMPRRVSDFPDAFVFWNYFSSLGSIISFVGTFFFIMLLFETLTKKNLTKRKTWQKVKLSISSFFILSNIGNKACVFYVNSLFKNFIVVWNWIKKLDCVFFYDSPEVWQINFQDEASPQMVGIINLHHDILVYLIFIGFFVFWFLFSIIYFFRNSTQVINVTHNTLIEIIWTIIPSLILVIIIVPSYILLYSLDFISNSYLTVKVIGKQWFWEYQISDFYMFSKLKSFNFESYMGFFENKPVTKSFFPGTLRLLDVDFKLILPLKLHIRFWVTSGDVLHSFAVPSLGIKIDACPGRLNQIGIFIKRKGVFFGMCSEICFFTKDFLNYFSIFIFY